jgi:hypothetical protein
MACLQADPSGNYHVSFRFGGREFKRSPLGNESWRRLSDFVRASARSRDWHFQRVWSL